MKICMLTSGHHPTDNRIFHREAKSLAGMGYDVVVVAPSEGDMKDAVEEEGVQIVPVRPFRRGWVRRLGILWDLLRKGFTLRAHVYHCHEPESLWVGVLIKALRGARAIYDVHEHWPSLIADHFRAPLRRGAFVLVEILERFASRRADGLFAVSGALGTWYNRKPVEVLYNCPPLRLFSPLRKGPPGRLVVYEGGISPDRGLLVFLEALRQVRARIPDVRFQVVGDLKGGEDREWVEEFVRRHGLEPHFELTGWLPYSEVPGRLMEADIGVILFQPVLYNNLIGVPNKLFEYMAAALPVVAPHFPEMGRIVHEVGCGVLVNPTDPEAVAHAIVRLLSHPEEAQRMGKQGRRAVEERYCWERMEEKLARVYDSVTL